MYSFTDRIRRMPECLTSVPESSAKVCIIKCNLLKIGIKGFKNRKNKRKGNMPDHIKNRHIPLYNNKKLIRILKISDISMSVFGNYTLERGNECRPRFFYDNYNHRRYYHKYTYRQ